MIFCEFITYIRQDKLEDFQNNSTILHDISHI